MSEQRVYRGWLCFMGNGDEDDILSLTDAPPRDTGSPYYQQPRGDGDGSFVSEMVMDDMEELGRYLSVRYFTSDTEATEQEMAEGFLRTLYGEGDADYGKTYSEITGYLWTTDELKVGGHDLLAELESHAGRFLHLEITYSRTAEPGAAEGAQQRE